MIIDITEEEREWLERVCTRAYDFTKKGFNIPKMYSDLELMYNLLVKLRKLDTNLINKDLNGMAKTDSI